MVNTVKWALRIPILHTEHITMNIFLYDKTGFQLKIKIQKYLCYWGTYDNYCLAWIIDFQKVPLLRNFHYQNFCLPHASIYLASPVPFYFWFPFLFLSLMLTWRTNISLGSYYLYLKTQIYIYIFFHWKLPSTLI